MLERRTHRRRRVCLEGVVAAGLITPMRTVRIRNMSRNGAEIVIDDGHIESKLVDFCSSRCEEVPRPARVIWRRMNHYGLEFLTPYGEPASGDEDAQTASAWNPLSIEGGFG